MKTPNLFLAMSLPLKLNLDSYAWLHVLISLNLFRFWPKSVSLN